MLEYVLFSIDNGNDVHTQAKFFRHVDTLRATGKLMGGMTSGVGSYNGDLERCYMVTAVDYERHFKSLDYLSGQESVLRVPGDTRQPCTLHYKDRAPQRAGMMTQVFDMPKGDFTYINGQYWKCINET